MAFLTERMLLGYGVDLYVHKLAEGLANAGHSVTVFCNVSDKTFQKSTYKIRRLKYRRSLTPSKTETNAFHVMETVVANQDLLIPCTFPYYYVAYRSKQPWVPIDFGVVPAHFYRHRVAGELRYHNRTQYGTYFPEAQRIVSISEYLKSQLPEYLRQKTTVIHPGINHYPDLFLCDIKSLFNIEGKIMLYFGRSMDFSPYKNTNGLLKVYRRLNEEFQDLRLLVSTNCSPEEQSRLERGGASVLNGVLMHFVPSIYNSADVYATATLWEGFDLPLLEASYFGLPVVAFPIGAHPEIVLDNDSGFLVDNEEQMIEKLRDLLASSHKVARMGASGKEFARSHFRWADKTRQFAAVIEGN